MTEKELRKTIKELKKEVWSKKENKKKSEDEINELLLDGFYNAYFARKICKTDLETIALILGYNLNPDFKKEAPEWIGER